MEGAVELPLYTKATQGGIRCAASERVLVTEDVELQGDKAFWAEYHICLLTFVVVTTIIRL
jgi:hypothetical protein